MNVEPLSSLKNVVLPFPIDKTSSDTLAIMNFARTNGFEYALENPDIVKDSWQNYKRFPAWFGSIGGGLTKHSYHVVSGSYKGYQLCMFLYFDFVKSLHDQTNAKGEYESGYVDQQTTGVVRVKLPKLFPQVLLDSSKNERIYSSLATNYNKSQLLQLEGDFNEHFDLYSPKNLQLNTLTLLAPNMMQILMKHSGLFDVEFYGDEIVFITKGHLYDPTTMTALFMALDEQLSYLDRLMLSWSYQPIDSDKIDVLDRSFIQGSSLNIGRLKVSAATQVISALALFGLLILISIVGGAAI